MMTIAAYVDTRKTRLTTLLTDYYRPYVVIDLCKFSVNPLGNVCTLPTSGGDTGGGDWDVSCVGATTQFGLSSIYGEYTMYIDNEVEPRVTGEPHELVNYAGANMSDTLFIDYDGYMYFTNLSSQNLKVRLVPVGGATATLYTETNPTLGVDANGVITACLAGI